VVLRRRDFVVLHHRGADESLAALDALSSPSTACTSTANGSGEVGAAVEYRLGNLGASRGFYVDPRLSVSLRFGPDPASAVRGSMEANQGARRYVLITAVLVLVVVLALVGHVLGFGDGIGYLLVPGAFLVVLVGQLVQILRFVVAARDGLLSDVRESTGGEIAWSD
jgi:hypothetical protein